MTFKEALKILNIEEYGQRIFCSNSRMSKSPHLEDYIELAKQDDVGWFRDWFIGVLKVTEEKGDQPELAFQHIPMLLQATKGQKLTNEALKLRENMGFID